MPYHKVHIQRRFMDESPEFIRGYVTAKVAEVSLFDGERFFKLTTGLEREAMESMVRRWVVVGR